MPSPSIDIVLSDSGFPDDFTGDPQAFKDEWLAYLQASIDPTKIIPGQVGGATPALVDNFAWLDNGIWKYSNGSAYVPVRTVLGNAGHVAELIAASLTGDRTVTFQNKTGYVAFLDDVFTPRATVVLTGATPNIDWSASDAFYLSMTSNVTISNSNSLPGQEIYIAILNASHTLTWTGVQWPTGTPPAQTATGKDLYRLENIAGTIYGEQVGANYL